MIKPELPEEVLNWLYFADEDYLSAKVMLKEEIYNKVCFLSQQTVEKALKAFLLNKKVPLKKTHKIVDLLSECVEFDSEFKSFEEEGVKIDRFYLPTRYPDAMVGSLPEGLPKKGQAQEVLEVALEMLEFVKKKLGIYA